MKANPGGQIDIKNILGRDRLINELWEVLEQQSVIITAERRIGKTSVILKMRAEPRENWFPVYQDLEKVHSADDFAMAVYDEIKHFLGLSTKIAEKAWQFWQAIGGTEVGGVLKLPEGTGKEKHWKALLTHAIEDLVTHQAPNRLVFFWDEMPYMLDSIRKRNGEATAMEVLDVLRALRQEAPGFRMVITGSIGLHHVLTTLKEADYKNAPINDMYSVEVTPLAPADAQDLARRLIDGETLTTSDRDRAAVAMAEQGDYFPFYIHHIARRLKSLGRAAEPAQIAETVQEQLTDGKDPWELGHYRSRIGDYFPKETAFVLAILGALAAGDTPLALDAVLAVLKAQDAQFDDRNKLLTLVRLLERDHYLARTKEGHYHFRFPLIRRWWRLDRGL